MFKLKQTGEMRRDCTAPYKVVLDKTYTVGELIKTILARTNDWGYIGIDNQKDIFGNPNCEYGYGKLLSTLPEEYLAKNVVSAVADGGYTRFDYLIMV